MSFLWPGALWLLAGLPLAVALYVLLLRRRKHRTLRISSVALVREAAGRHGAWRRHVPPVLLLAALGTLAVATARPTMALRLPGQQQTIVLAMDVSGSMRAADVQPNRLVAAQNAAKAFVQALPRNVRVGVVEFAGTAAIVQPPTENHAEVLASIDRFQLQRGTAIGSGIVLSLAAMFPEAGIELSRIARGRGAGLPPMVFGSDGGSSARDSARAQAEFTPVPAGSYDSGAVILLTDGQRTTGPDPIDAAQMAADRGVKIYSVGIGTKEGETISFEGWTLRVRLDEETLKRVSEMTKAEYFYAGTAQDLLGVYERLSTKMVMEKKETEISALLAGAGALLMLVAAGLSIVWFGRSGG